MAWSRDPRTPTRYMRGSKRYNDVGGHSPPGDELENTRDHERIWFELRRSRSCCDCHAPGFKVCFDTFDWPQYICDGEFPGGDTLEGYWPGDGHKDGPTLPWELPARCAGSSVHSEIFNFEPVWHLSGSWRNGPYYEKQFFGNNLSLIDWSQLFPDQDWTFEAWIRPAASNLSSGDPIISAGYFGTISNSHGFEAFYKSNGGMSFRHESIGGGELQESNPGWFEAGQWHHFVVVRNAASRTIAFFVNGKLVISRVLPTTITAGSGSYAMSPDRGDWSDLALYSSALSPSVIRRHYQAVYGVEGVPNPIADDEGNVEDPGDIIIKQITIDHIDGGGSGNAGYLAVSRGDYTDFVSPEDSPFELEERKGVADGYAGLDAGAHVETDQLGTGTANADSFLRGDQTWQEGQLLPLPETLYDFISVGPDSSEEYVSLETSLGMHKYAFQEASAPFSASPASTFGTFGASGVAPSKSSDRPRSFFDEEYLVFDDTDGLVSSGVFAQFDWVHSFWIRLDEIPASSKTVVRHNTQTYLKVKNDGRLELSGFSGSVVITSTDPLVVGEWTHVVIGSETGFAAISWLIINGVIQTGSNVSSTGNFTVYLGGDGIQMGLARFAGQYFEIDDIPGSVWTAMANSRGLRWQTIPEVTGGGAGGLDASENDTPVTAAPRTRVNFIEGANVSLTVADDAANDEIDVTIAATSPAGSGIEVSAEGVDVSASPRGRIDFVEGANVALTVTDDGANDKVIVEVAAVVPDEVPDPSGETDGRVLTVATGAAVWSDPPAGGGGGGGGAGNVLVDYVERTTTHNPGGSESTVLTSNPVTFDGTSQYKFEFFCPLVALFSNPIQLKLREDPAGANTFRGILGQLSDGDDQSATLVSHVLTPPAGTYAYSITSLKTSGPGTPSLNAGDGTSYVPMYLLITKLVDEADAGGGGGGGGAPLSAVKAIRAANQSIANATETPVQFDEADEFDTDGYHDPASNNTRITIPAGKGGLYLLIGETGFASTGTTGDRAMYLKKNGTTYIHTVNHRAGANFGTYQQIVGFVELVPGDYVEFALYHNQGTSQNVSDSKFSALLIRDGGGVDDGSGWTAAGETWTYGAADDPTYTMTVSGDKTSKYSPGMRVKVTQTTGGTKYGIITKVAYSAPDTTLTVYWGTDYDLANEAISSPYYSVVKAPAGFPLNPAKWTVSFTDSSRRTASGTASSTWYSPGSVSFDLPIGVWDFNYFAIGYCARASGATLSVQISMSTSPSTETDTDLTAYWYLGTLTELSANAARRKTLVLTAKTTYYPVIWAAGGSLVGIAFLNDFKPLSVKAVCAYL